MSEGISNNGRVHDQGWNQSRQPLPESSGQVFGRGVSLPKEGAEPRILRASGLVQRSSKAVMRRCVAIRRPRPQVNPEVVQASRRKKALKAEVLCLDPQNKGQIEQWVQKMKQGLGQVADDLKSRGIKEVTMDLKLDELFKGYRFASQDLDLLNKLKSLGRSDNLISHLQGKISMDITDHAGLEQDGKADFLARRNPLASQEAHAARQQFLTELDPNSMAVDPLEVMAGLIGRPYGLRQELESLQNQLGSRKLMFSTKGVKARKLRKAVQTFLATDKRKDLVQINHFVIMVKRQLDTMPGLQKQAGLSNWPGDYPQLMNPGKRA